MRKNKKINDHLKGNALISKQILSNYSLSNIWISVWRILCGYWGLKSLMVTPHDFVYRFKRGGGG